MNARIPRDDPALPRGLEEIERHCFALLARGVRDRRSAFHLATLASLGRDGFPAARTVVLRAADPVARTLRFNTDRRSRKFAELEAEARVAILFYDPRARLQFRFRAVATLHAGDETAHAIWRDVSASSRRCYLGQPPGAASDAPTSGLPPELEGRAPSAEESVPGLANFAAIRVRLLDLDWLHLAAGGHRRARIDWRDPAAPAATWLAP
jgi:pyridoxamine 5'-phosphate oxidase